MIPATTIKTIMVALSSYLGITFQRSDIPASITTYPYFTYKVLSANQENAYQDIITITENSIDSSNADITRYEKVEAIISLNFFDKNRVDRIYTYTQQALQWFKSVSGIETCKTNSIIPRMINTIIQDRSVFQEAYWENRFGFDVRFDYSGSYTQTIEAVETIEVTPTIDGDEKEKFIYEA